MLSQPRDPLLQHSDLCAMAMMNSRCTSRPSLSLGLMGSIIGVGSGCLGGSATVADGNGAGRRITGSVGAGVTETVASIKGSLSLPRAGFVFTMAYPDGFEDICFH